MTVRRWDVVATALGLLGAALGVLAVILFVGWFASVWALLIASAVACGASWLIRRRIGASRPFLWYDVALIAAVAVACANLLWTDSPAEPAGWPLVFLLLAVPAAIVWALRCAATAGRGPVKLVLAVPVILALTIGLAFTGALTTARYQLAKDEFQAAASNPPAPGEGRDLRIGTFSAHVFTTNDGIVKFRFGNSWTGLMYVPEGHPDPPREPYFPVRWAPRWWTWDTD